MKHHTRRVAVVGNAPPRKCGLATFTGHLTDAFKEHRPHLEILRLAMNDRVEGYAYGPEISFEMQQDLRSDYLQAAAFLNKHRPDVLCVQHEFGIYGGVAGSYVLDLIEQVDAPVVTTLHTVLDRPSPEQLEVTRRLARRSATLVTMSERGAQFLEKVYGVSVAKIKVIPHGIPDIPFKEPGFTRGASGAGGRLVMLTFGLLGRNKGIETVIRALPRITARYPQFVYRVLGATHPHVLAHEGESYRKELLELASALGVSEHVRFDNRYVTQAELTRQIAAADLYCTPYRQREQITSGTLAYALGAGKAVLSTPYWHAEELLADGRGLLFDFDDDRALSARVNSLLGDEALRLQLQQRAYRYGRAMAWSAVADKYLTVFGEVSKPGKSEVRGVSPTYAAS